VPGPTDPLEAGPDLERLCINVIRGLAMDAPQKANSGHPGTAMALAPLAHVLWTRVMRHDPSRPDWPDRDRFVLSNGHACILQYAMLFLTGYGLSLEDIEAFRQWDSLTPGHPETERTVGIEVTTGPLGQGFANGVGMGIAERYLRARFSAEVCDHHTFVIAGDGCLEEGISHEAASLAGHLGLGRLVYVYDDNHITIDGPTELSYSDDVAERFDAYGWDVDRVGEVANDTAALEAALERAKAVEDRPSLIILRSHIGWPAPHKTDTAAAHGSPLGEDEIEATKEILGLPPHASFYVPEEVLAFYRRCIPRGQAMVADWERRFSAWSGDKEAWEAAWDGRGLKGWEAKLPGFEPGTELATRRALNACLKATDEVLPGLVYGGADLTENTGVEVEGPADRQSAGDPGGRQIYFGVREHAMGAVMTGMAHHGGLLPVGGTFFVFSDYMRGAVRLASLSEAHVIYSWTHDSVGLGEDGPTHQPVEQLASLRAMPGLRLIRPADATETAQAFRLAVELPGPTGLVLSRQNLPVLEATERRAAAGVPRGAYVVLDEEGPLELVLVGTGGEVAVCLEAAGTLVGDGVATRVVSFPSWELFEDQDEGYREEVLPSGVPTLAVEAATSFGWERYADATVTLDRFGASAPGTEALRRFGFTADNVVARAQALLAGRQDPGHAAGRRRRHRAQGGAE
jgi:transketolase